MTQTKIDIDHAEAPELIRALAEKPCVHTWGPSMHPGAVPMPELDKLHPHPKYCNCHGFGLANPWASEKCRVPVSTFLPQHESPGHHPNCGCNGSGRVPKAVGLEDLFLYLAAPDGTYIVYVETNWTCPHEFGGSWSVEEDEHLASPCEAATFTCVVTRGQDTAWEVSGKAIGPALNADLLTLAALRTVAETQGL